MQAQWLFQAPVGISITGWGRSELSLLKFVAFARSRDLEIPGPSLPRPVSLPEPFWFFPALWHNPQDPQWRTWKVEFTCHFWHVSSLKQGLVGSEALADLELSTHS